MKLPDPTEKAAFSAAAAISEMATEKPLILIVEEVLALALQYKSIVTATGNTVWLAASLDEAHAIVGKRDFHAAIIGLHTQFKPVLSNASHTDLFTTRPFGLAATDLLRQLSDQQPECPVILIADHLQPGVPSDAGCSEVLDVLEAPVDAQRLELLVRGLSLRSKLQDKKNTDGDTGRHGFIGNSAPMQAVFTLLDRVSASHAPVFITGESGTGKELCARAIHANSARRSGPCITLNCAAIPKDLIDSEIFGHVKGAYTGASTDRMGAAMAAHGGTLFLDEICEMDPHLQAKLLRLLEAGEVRRVGENIIRHVDVRLVCATNRDPAVEIREGRFRADLYYRLHVVPIHLPPLHARGADVLLIARVALRRYAREEDKRFRDFSPLAAHALMQYHWPGNVRQLLNCVRAIVVLANAELVEVEMLPLPIRKLLDNSSAQNDTRFEPAVVDNVAAHTGHHSKTIRPEVDMVRPLALIEREAIEASLRIHGGSVARAARALAINPSTLYRKIQAWNSQQDVAGEAASSGDTTVPVAQDKSS